MRGGYFLGFYLAINLLCFATVGKATPNSEKKEGLEPLLASEDNHWETFKNTKNGFEFEMPVCFQAEDLGDPAEISNFVRISPGKKCRPSSENRSVEFTSPDGISIVDLKRALKNPQSLHNREINLNGRKAVLSGRRYNDGHYDGVAWTAYTSCNSKNVYIGFVENLDAEGLKKVKEGTQGLPPLINRIVHSFKCHERESKKTKVKQVHLAPEEDHWEVFKNTKNGFEFEMPICFQAEDLGDPAEISNFVRISPGKKCRPSSKNLSVEFSAPDGIPVKKLKLVLKNPKKLHIERLTINGKAAVLSAKRYNDGHTNGVVWNLWIACNSKNLDVTMGENVNAEELKKIKSGSRSAPAFFLHIIHSLKCF